MLFVRSYLIALVLFLCIDMVWLGVLAKNLYQEQIGFLMADRVRLLPAILFYFLYILGLVFFVIFPSLKTGGIGCALLTGALFGLICYATYDLTNLATLKGWPVKVVVYDLLWGAFVSGATAGMTSWICTYWKGSCN